MAGHSEMGASRFPLPLALYVFSSTPTPRGRGSGSGQSLCLTHTPPSHGHACVPEGELLLCNGVAQGVCLGESQSSGLGRTVQQLLSFRAS